MPVPKSVGAAPIVGQTMTKLLRMIKRHRRARARWSPKRLELGAIPA
jgi:hypothetical protein